MSNYASNRERRRGSRLCFALLFLVLMTAAQPVGLNSLLYLIPGVALLVAVCVFFVSRKKVPTPTEIADNGLSARLPVWAARVAGAGISANLRDSIELPGRLLIVNGHLEWRPSARSSRRGAVNVVWGDSDILNADVKSIWGIVPTCLLHLSGTYDVDIWIIARASSLNEMLTFVPVT